MTPPAPFFTGYYRPQTLPVELIDAILASIQLHSDLAKCCRVNKHFLSRCRPALYHRLPILCGTPLIEPDDYIQGYNLDERSKKLFQTLKANVHLRRYPRKLSLEIVDAEQEWVVYSDENEGGSDVEEGDTSRGYYEFDYEYGDPSQPLEMFMALLPRATSVYIVSMAWWWRPVRDVVFGNGARWKEIEVDGDSLLSEEDDKRDLRELRALEKLECIRMGYTGLPDQNLPRSLRTLRTWGYQLPKGKPTVDYQLRHLRVTMSAETIIHLPAYQRLQHLHLDQSSDAFEPLPPTALLGFQSLPNLRSLSFTVNGLYNHATATASLLAHLPPSLSRLEFPDKVPFDVLDHFVKHRSSQARLTLRIREGITREEGHKTEFDQLAKLCREQSIEIFLIPLPDYSWLWE